jgi:hypothetical protein
VANTYLQKTGTNPDGSGPKRISELQQQVLLLLVGAVWMGLSLASLTFAALSAEAGAGPGVAKEIPADLTKPAGYVPPATPPVVQPSKA